MQAVDIVQRQVEAYNARDLKRFLACYADEVRAYRPPALEPVIVGKAAFSEFYANERFNRPALHAEIVSRMVLGHTVIDHERITGVLAQPFEVAVVYLVEHGLIQCTWAFAAG